jgi:hypothetical protein
VEEQPHEGGGKVQKRRKKKEKEKEKRKLLSGETRELRSNAQQCRFNT